MKTENGIFGVFILSVMVLVGVGLLYYCFANFNYTWDAFVWIISVSGLLIAVALLFIFMGVFGIGWILKEKLAPIEEIIVKLAAIEKASQYANSEDVSRKVIERASQYMASNDILYFLIFMDTNNKEYSLGINNIGAYEPNKNYYIKVKGEKVVSVIGETKDHYAISEKRPKESYWMNFYTPYGSKIEGVLLLPVAYAIFLPFFLGFIFSKGFDKIFSLPMMAASGYLLVYDFYQKYKNR